jgi:large subunit ribosomal protein L23
MHLYEVLKRPILTEKSLRLADEQNQYVFEVDRRANKILVKQAVEARFGVTVTDVRIINMKPKTRRRSLRQTAVRKPGWKKAIVTLAPGDSIQLYEGV